MTTKNELKELQNKFLKTLDDYHNYLMEQSKREQSFNYVCVNSETFKKIKELNIEIKEL